MVIPAGLVGGGEAVAAGLADGVATPFVLVVGSDISDALVEPNGVVVAAHPFELGGKYGGVADGEQVRVLGLDVTPQRLDPSLVGRGVGPAEVLADPTAAP